MDKTFKLVVLKREDVHKQALPVDDLKGLSYGDLFHFSNFTPKQEAVCTIETSYLGKKMFLGDLFYNKYNEQIVLFAIEHSSGAVKRFVFYIFEDKDDFSEFIKNGQDFSKIEKRKVSYYFFSYANNTDDLVRLGNFFVDDLSLIEDELVKQLLFTSNDVIPTTLKYRLLSINDILMPSCGYKYLYALDLTKIEEYLNQYISVYFSVYDLLEGKFEVKSGHLFVFMDNHKVKQIERVFFDEELEKQFPIQKNKEEFLEELEQYLEACKEGFDDEYATNPIKIMEISPNHPDYQKYLLQYI